MVSDQDNRIVNVADYDSKVEELVKQIIEVTDKIAYVADVVKINTLHDIEDEFARACQPLADRLNIDNLDFICENADQIIDMFEQVLDEELVNSIWDASNTKYNKTLDAKHDVTQTELMRLRDFYVDQLLDIVGSTTSIEYGELNISLGIVRNREWKVTIL